MNRGLITENNVDQITPHSQTEPVDQQVKVGMNRRMPGLDVLRAFAVLGVILAHYEWNASDPLPLPAHVLSRVLDFGGVGVDLFFVLSGFLVSGLLFREYIKHGSVNIKRFLIRRGLKIYPAYYVLFACSLLAYYALGWPLCRAVTWKSALAEMFFVSNYSPGFWGHTWSLGVEEHFYALVALWIYLRASTKKSGMSAFQDIGKVSIIVIAFCFLSRLLTYTLISHRWESILTPTHNRMDSLTIGVLLSYYYNTNTQKFQNTVSKYRIPIFIVGLLSLVSVPLLNKELLKMILSPTLKWIGFSAVLCLVVCSNAVTSRVWRFVAYIGEHSYSIYLWHYAVLLWLPKLLPMRSSITGLLINIVIAVAYGIAVARLVEIPVLRVRDRLFPSRIGSISTAK